MYLIEVDAAVDAAGTVQTLYLSTQPFVTSPTDTPANTFFEPSATNPGLIRVSLYADGRTGGGTELELGELVFANDGRYDTWKGFGFDGRRIIVRQGEAGGAYPADFPIVLRGTCAGPADVAWDQVVLRLRAPEYVLDRALLTDRFTGAGGLEGGPDDIQGQIKPRVYGGPVYEIAPKLVNPANLTYRVSDRAVTAIDVIERGDETTIAFGSNHANNAALTAAVVAAGTYHTCLAEGLFRLGSSPAGEITADVTAGAATANRTPAQVMKQIGLDMGLSVNAADVTALDLVAADAIGLYLDADTVARDLLDRCAESCGGWWYVDIIGELRMGRLAAPTGTPAAYLYEWNAGLGAKPSCRPAGAGGVPCWRVVVKYARFHTTQTSDLGGGVSAARANELKEEWRSVYAEDAGIKDQFLTAPELVVETLLTSEADAQDLADALLALHGVPRSFYDVPAWSQEVASVDLAHDVVEVTLDRYGLDAGELLRVLGKGHELAKGVTTLVLWG